MPFVFSLSLALAITAYLHAHNGQYGQYTPSPLRQLMNLSDLPPGRLAPDFNLVDQAGQSVSLGQLRGKAILLAFMDSHCTQVCPVLAQEFILANQDLGSLASKVAFVGVNVNSMAASVSDVATFTRLHGLSHLNNWYFLTGSAAKLVPVWKAYGIAVFLPKNATQTVHADYLYFITPSGHERYIATPIVDQAKNGRGFLPQTTLKQWGQGIATYLSRILEKS